MAAESRSILVVDPNEMTDGIVRDLHEVIVRLCARVYRGKRSIGNRCQERARSHS
ncbi:hypothetical protein MPNT_10398 [Candidatus Methylacidithermus pantelleriae]|uniref:Uncharacterized protein n=1 Tax=Candidatus Methylacidithermus pantelleriae TaxID=2744239 RepID=A0A8J2BHN0_9BACT|nr:hypothetical protein MPNT_10398 [Candidatus Methylacidithermus pantelleriae]